MRGSAVCTSHTCTKGWIPLRQGSPVRGCMQCLTELCTECPKGQKEGSVHSEGTVLMPVTLTILHCPQVGDRQTTQSSGPVL